MHSSAFLVAFTILTVLGSSLAITCYKCDSITLPDCATSLDSEILPTEECRTPYNCALSIVDSVTYRGCSSNTPRGPVYYKTCNETLCNNGVYPPGRLKCHQCSGSSCLSQQTAKPTPCLNFKEDDKCYTDVIDEIQTYRGCDSDNTKTHSDSVVYCEINGCNSLKAVETLTCSKCDSYDARGCKMDLFEIYNSSCVITNQTTCSDVALLGHEQPSCFLYVNLNHVVRGCTWDSDKLSFDSDNFDTCYTNLCNKNCLKPQKCIDCNSNTNVDCRNNPESLTATTCESAEVSSCHTCESKDGSLRRGCGFAPSTPGTQDMRCNECQGEGCNNLNLTKCYKCSSDESPNCGQWINPNIIDVEHCELAGAGCVSAVFLNGKTVRGCESPQLKCNNTQTRCFSCSGNLCNDGVYPPTRLLCHHCDGREKCSNIVDSSNLRPCAEYDSNDACFEFLSGKNTMVRGCRSDKNLYYECLLATQNGNGCRLCAGPGCNMLPASRPSALSCYKCSRADQACSWLQGSNENLQICQEVVKFSTFESCFTRRYMDGSTSRGCSLDVANAPDNDGDEYLEQICTNNGCNDKCQVAQKCISCEGSLREANNVCLTAIGNVEGVLCNNGSVKLEARGCYTKVSGDIIQRGCASDLTSTELQKCQRNDGGDCFYCRGIDCNTSSNLTFTSRNSGSDVHRVLYGFNLLACLIYISII